MFGRANVGAAHFHVALQAHFGKDRRQMVGPVRHCGPLAWQRVELALEQMAEIGAGDVVIGLAALDEIHRHFDGPIDITLEAKALLERKRHHPGAIVVGVAPDFRSR